jgi:hypothetical protein
MESSERQERSSKSRPKRYSISVTGETYARLRATVAESTSIQKFVDDLITSALDDALVAARVVGQCTELG